MKEVTIICCYNNIKMYEDLIDSLTTETIEYDVVGINNSNGKYSSCSSALNAALKQVKTEFVIFSHQDILFPAYDSLERFLNYLKKTENYGIIGVAGKVAGVTYSNILHGNQLNKAGKELKGLILTNNLDECFFGGKTKWFLDNPFNEQLCDSWHLYAVERSLHATKHGDNVYVCDIPLIHRSTGNVDRSFDEGFNRLCDYYEGDFDYIETTCSYSRTEKSDRLDRLREKNKERKKLIKFSNSKKGWKSITKKYEKFFSKKWIKRHFIDYKLKQKKVGNLTAKDYFLYEFYKHDASFMDDFFLGNEFNTIVNKLNDRNKVDAWKKIMNNRILFNGIFSKYVGIDFLDCKGISLEEFETFCGAVNNKTINGKGKVALRYIDARIGKKEIIGEVDSSEKIRFLFENINNQKLIAEEYVDQCTEFSTINPTSQNVIRIITIKTNGKIEAVDALLMVGMGSEYYYSPGMKLYAGININTGVVDTDGVRQNDIRKYSKHPLTGEPIYGFIVPKWNEVIRTAKVIHETEASDMGYMVWDLSINERGEVVLIGVSPKRGINELQMTGPDGRKLQFRAYA